MATTTTSEPEPREAPLDGEARALAEVAREAWGISPGLASGGSAASRLLCALLQGHPNLAAWG